MSTQISARFSVILTLFALAAGTVRAQEPAELPPMTPDEAMADEWNFSLRPYFFLSGVSGSVTSAPLTIPINSTFGELLDNVEISAFLAFTAEKGKWGAYADVQYIDLLGEGTGMAGTTLELSNLIAEADLTFRPGGSSTLKFVGGLRVYSVDQTLTIASAQPISATTTVYDPVIGVVGSWSLGDRWDFELRGDIGGFGVSSELTNQLSGIVLWRAGDHVRIPFGYRVLSYQIKDDPIWMNTMMTGFVVGVDIAL